MNHSLHKWINAMQEIHCFDCRIESLHNIPLSSAGSLQIKLTSFSFEREAKIRSDITFLFFAVTDNGRDG